MESKLFSIVIPAYNREKTIERSINSALNQTYDNVEVIVVDDGSVDNTKEVVNKYIPRIKYIYQENSGAQRARNNGLLHAKGEFILFLDSDDELLPECLNAFVDKYEKDKDLGAVYCLTGIVDEYGVTKPVRKDYLCGYVYPDVLRQGYLTSSSFISMRRSIFEKIGNWDESFSASQDDDICFRIAKKYKIGIVDQILGLYWTDAGKGKQIGSSPTRVAEGWWHLWNKFESDVLIECGSKTMAKHYFECKKRFIKCKNKQRIKECDAKLIRFCKYFEYLRYKILGTMVYIKHLK